MDMREIAKAVKAKNPWGFKNIKIKGVSIDSRTIKKGEVFIAIEGDRFNGHDFVDEAFRKGAAAAIVKSKKYKSKEKIIVVKDTLKALGDIAYYHRQKFKIPVIAITGSTGKTTVKEIISRILSERYRVLKNEKTENNFIGLPLTLLKLDDTHEVAVLEMGMNHLEEIKGLSKIAEPETGVITNIGPSHLEFLKSVDNVLKAKKELLDSLRRNQTAILNKDDRLLVGVNAECRKIYFGIDEPCDFRATHIETKNGRTAFKVNNVCFRISLLGRHNVYNALAGIAIGEIYGIRMNSISRILEDFKNPYDNRLSLIKTGDIYILNDSYNANPMSFEVALESLRNLGQDKRKVVIQADMLELGKKSAYFHRKLGRDIARSGVELLVGLGPMSRITNEAALKNGMKKGNALHFEERKDLIKKLHDIIKKGDIILVKGSRAMHMEEAVEQIKKIRS